MHRRKFGKLKESSLCAASYSSNEKASLGNLPVIEVGLGDKCLRALVDTGCTTTIVHSKYVTDIYGDACIKTFDDSMVKCKSVENLEVVVGGTCINVERALVVDKLVRGVDFVIGVDIINKLGGVNFSDGVVTFGSLHVASAVISGIPQQGQRNSYELENAAELVVEDVDFKAIFDGQKWTVEWFWKHDQPVKLYNKISCYDKGLEGNKKFEFEKEIDRWIAEGILIPWREEVNAGILPLMAVEQPTKNKVRPVLDFRELNKHVKSHTGDDVIDVCCETLREWRRVGQNVSVVDLKAAYLQLGIDQKLWEYQLIKYKGQTFCLTRLGFGLNSAPRIMSKILKTVLSMDENIKRATSSYIDDILVNEDIVSADKVIIHLNKYGLVTKPPEVLTGGAVLGLQLREVGGEILFYRNNKIPEVKEELTKRELFSICGTLTGHYPVAGWLRVAASYIKRRAEGSHWEDYVGDQAVQMIKEAIQRVKLEDPVRGSWSVSRDKHCIVWTDASMIAIGVVMEISGRVVEDAAWLRKKDDVNHINVAELEAVLKGMNLALKWGVNSIELRVDSATVVSWLKSVLSSDRRVHTKGASEMIIKRRLGNFKELVDEFGLDILISFTPSFQNKADELTRVPKKWLVREEKVERVDGTVELCSGVFEDVKKLHDNHHMGVDRTLFLVRKVLPSISRDDVKQVVRACVKCQSIDPAPVVHTPGELSVASNWCRLAVDVTHYRGLPYLSMVDCGPSRFAIWRALKSEDARSIVVELDNVFVERGPVDELLLDNSAAFRSQFMTEMAAKWNLDLAFRAAYRPSGNGIVERHHRTIKCIAERGDITPIMAVFWYNSTPRTGQQDDSVPHMGVYRYNWRYPLVKPEKTISDVQGVSSIKMGDEVWVKPPQSRCTSQWSTGRVTGVNSANNIEVDGMPRHVLDIRPVIESDSSQDDQVIQDVAAGDQVGQDGDTDDQQPRTDEVVARPQRTRRAPAWLGDYVT